jgi:acyl-CoA synthetase (AMP-forming)/AMP-acid ligase II
MHTGSLVLNDVFLTMLPAMFTGATFILMPHFHPIELIHTIAQERATHVTMVPSQILATMRAPNFSPESLRSLQMLGSLGAPLHREQKEKLVRALPGIFCELYGMTEGFVTVLIRMTARPSSARWAPRPHFLRFVLWTSRAILWCLARSGRS